MIARCIRILLALLVVAAFAAYLSLVYLYKVKDSGVVYLENAKSPVSVTREVDSQIAHIRSNSIEATIYGQGFTIAQDRLWMLER